jgi:hypothetical protein
MCTTRLGGAQATAGLQQQPDGRMKALKEIVNLPRQR